MDEIERGLEWYAALSREDKARNVPSWRSLKEAGGLSKIQSLSPIILL